MINIFSEGFFHNSASVLLWTPPWLLVSLGNWTSTLFTVNTSNILYMQGRYEYNEDLRTKFVPHLRYYYRWCYVVYSVQYIHVWKSTIRYYTAQTYTKSSYNVQYNVSSYVLCTVMYPSYPLYWCSFRSFLFSRTNQEITWDWDCRQSRHTSIPSFQDRIAGHPLLLLPRGQCADPQSEPQWSCSSSFSSPRCCTETQDLWPRPFSSCPPPHLLRSPNCH